MFDEDNDNNESQLESVNRYEDLLKNKKPIFFDVEEFRDIIDFYLQNNQFNSAVKATKIASELHPNSTEILLKKAQILIDNGNFNQGLKILDKLVKVDSHNFEIYLAKGVALTQQDKVKEAFENFKLAYQKASVYENGEVLNVAGDILFNYAYYNEALYFKEIAYKTLTFDNDLASEIGICYFNLDNYEKALTFLLKAVDGDPFLEMAWYNLGNVYKHINKFELAIEAYDYAWALNTSIVNALIQKASCLAELNREIEAIPIISNILSEDKENILAVTLIVNLYFNTKQYQNVIDIAIEALAWMPENDMIIFTAARAYFELKRYNEALVFIEKAIILEPDVPIYYDEAINYAFEAGEYKKVYSFLPYIFNEDRVNYFIYLIKYKFKTNTPESALRAIKRALKYNTGIIEFYYLKVAALYLMNKKEQAQKLFNHYYLLEKELFDEFNQFWFLKEHLSLYNELKQNFDLHVKL